MHLNWVSFFDSSFKIHDNSARGKLHKLLTTPAFKWPCLGIHIYIYKQNRENWVFAEKLDLSDDCRLIFSSFLLAYLKFLEESREYFKK